MDLEHLLTLAQARSFVAALADTALGDDASTAFERVLIELDWLHDDESPGLDTAPDPSSTRRPRTVRSWCGARARGSGHGDPAVSADGSELVH